MKLVIATPSPFARKARIALLEKAVPHEVLVQNPWQAAIRENPLGKVPVLILGDGTVLHDSSVIVEYLEKLGARGRRRSRAPTGLPGRRPSCPADWKSSRASSASAATRPSFAATVPSAQAISIG